MKVTLDQIRQAVLDCSDTKTLTERLGLQEYGNILRRCKINGIDVSHIQIPKKPAPQVIERVCASCGDTFSGLPHKIGDKKTCSRSCANRYFRSGSKNGNWRGKSYRLICFQTHKKACIICGESKIVEVHHFNGKHDDNQVGNLIPLCPTHHQYMHSRYSKLIEDRVNQYQREFSLKYNGA